MAASHQTETTPDGKVRIKDLELFMGYDPSIDAEDDDAMQEYDSKKVKDIVSRTNKFIARGSRPKLVIEHEKDGKPSNPKAVGDIEKVWLEERNGVSYVIGDVIMPKESFKAYLATNAFPRRSAEIWKDNHLSEVALLGRDTPRRPLPDTSFTKLGDKIIFERKLSALDMTLDLKSKFDEIGVGGGSNTFVPSSGIKKETKMAKKKRMEADEELKQNAAMECAVDPDEDEENFEGDDLETMEADAEAMGADDMEDEMAEDDDMEVMAEDDDEEMNAYGGKKKMKQPVFSKGSRSEKALFAQVQALTQANAAMERQLRLERFGKEVDNMVRDGFRCSKFRNQMVEELADSETPQAKVSFWKATMARDLTGMPMLAQMTVQNDSPSMGDREASDRAVREAAGDMTKFKQLFSKYTGKQA